MQIFTREVAGCYHPGGWMLPSLVVTEMLVGTWLPTIDSFPSHPCSPGITVKLDFGQWEVGKSDTCT